MNKRNHSRSKHHHAKNIFGDIGNTLSPIKNQVEKGYNDLISGKPFEAAADILEIPADVIRGGEKMIDSKADKAIDKIINKPGPKPRSASKAVEKSVKFTNKDKKNALNKLQNSTKHPVPLDNKKRKRTGNPYHDGLVGVESNPGWKNKKDHKKHPATKGVKKHPTKKHPKKPHSAPGGKDVKMMSTSSTSVFSTKTHFKVVNAGPNGVRVTGRQRLTSIFVDSSPAAGKLLAVMNLTPGALVSTRLSPYFAQYERWRPNKLAFTLIPRTASTTTGSYFMFTEPDPDDSIMVTGLYDLEQVANQQGCVETSAWGVASHNVRPKDNRDPDLWTGTVSTENPYASNETTEARLYSAGQLIIVTGDPLPAGIKLGTLFVDFDITFKIAVEGDALTSVTTTVVAGNTSSTNPIMTLAGLGVLTGGLSVSTINSGCKGFISTQSESQLAATQMDYNPGMNANITGVSPSAMLPTGEYLIEVAMQLGTNGNSLSSTDTLYVDFDNPTATTAASLLKNTAGAYVYTNQAFALNSITPTSSTAYPTNIKLSALNQAPLLKGSATDQNIAQYAYTLKRMYKSCAIFRIFPDNASHIFTGFSWTLRFKFNANTADTFILSYSYRLVRLSQGPYKPTFYATNAIGLSATAPLIQRLLPVHGKDEVKEDKECKKDLGTTTEDETDYEVDYDPIRLKENEQRNVFEMLRRKFESG